MPQCMSNCRCAVRAKMNGQYAYATPAAQAPVVDPLRYETSRNAPTNARTKPISTTALWVTNGFFVSQ